MRTALLFLLLASCSDGTRGTSRPVSSCSVRPSSAWSERVTLPADPFVSSSQSPRLPSWIKFTVLECDASTVYFQDSVLYPFHYDFAVNELDPLQGLSRAEFDARTLRESGRVAFLGAVLMPSSYGALGSGEELGIQLVAADPIPSARVVELFHLVKSRLGVSPAADVFYFPTLEQAPSARADVDFLASQGVELSSPARWSPGDVVYSSGWALGRLKYFEASEVEDAYGRGELRPSDVLFTDGVPASVPLVAGILSSTPSVPSSHTAILAQTFGVPFGFLADESERLRVEALEGRRVIVRAYEGFGVTSIDVFDIEGRLDEGSIAEILALAEPPALALDPTEDLGELARSVSDLELDDVRFVGGKSAGMGVVARAIPAHSPRAVAFSFDLWNRFLAQALAGATTLRDAIDTRLAPYGYPPSDMAALSADLEEIRDLIEDPARSAFAPGDESAVLGVLTDPLNGFQLGAKIRFRSSSNMEDAESFTGAGLYASHSGCVLDDLDADAEGPSLCDASKSSERGVFRAIRKTFASFYEDNAFLARLRYGVDEHDVGMAILAHHSFPDEFELANGVATYTRPVGGIDRVELATQAGGVSVTNPEPGEVPELTTGYLIGTAVFDLEQESNLVQLGATVMEWESDYVELAGLLERAAGRFEAETGKADFVLELEFKKLAPGGAALPAGGLVVKQLREVPQPDTNPSLVPFLLGSTVAHETLQGEVSNVVSNHRLKSELELTLRSGWMDEVVLELDLFSGAKLRFTDGCGVRDTTFDLADPAVSYQRWDGSDYELVLEQPGLENPRSIRLRTFGLPTRVSQAQSPILVAEDLTPPRMDVDHAVPVPVWEGFPTAGLTPVISEFVHLSHTRATDAPTLPQVRRFQSGNIQVDIEFDWPRRTGFVSAGYTAPLAGWTKVVIQGLTTAPIVLTDDFALTYRPGHHNFSEHFLFQPRLDPGVPASTLAELADQDIEFIRVLGAYAPVEATIETYSKGELGTVCPAIAARR